MKFDCFFTLFHKYYFLPRPSVNFDLLSNLVKNSTCRLFSGWKRPCLADITPADQSNISFQEINSTLDFGLYKLTTVSNFAYRRGRK